MAVTSIRRLHHLGALHPAASVWYFPSTEAILRQEPDPNASLPRNAPIAPSVHRLGFAVTTSRLALRLSIFPADLQLGTRKFSTRCDHLRLIFLLRRKPIACRCLYRLQLTVVTRLRRRICSHNDHWIKKESGEHLGFCLFHVSMSLQTYRNLDIEALKLLTQLRRVSKRFSYPVDCTTDTEVECEFSSLNNRPLRTS